MYSASGGVANGGRIYNPRPDPAEVGPPRRVNREETHVGEHIASSKRRIAWTFTLGESDTIHEVVLVHSIMSYKKTIEFDGRQMHYSAVATPGDWTYTMFLDGTKYAFEVRINDLESVEVPKYDLVIDRVPYRRWDVYRRRKHGAHPTTHSYGGQQQQAQPGGSFGTHKWGPSGMTAPEPSPPRGVASQNSFRRDAPTNGPSGYQSPPQSQQYNAGYQSPPQSQQFNAPPPAAARPPTQPAQPAKKPAKEIDLLGDFTASDSTTVSAQQLFFDPLASSKMGAPPAPQPNAQFAQAPQPNAQFPQAPQPNAQFAQAPRTASNPAMQQTGGYPLQMQPQNTVRTASSPSIGYAQPYVDPFASVTQPLPMKPVAQNINLDPLASQNSTYMQANRQVPVANGMQMGVPGYNGYPPQQQQAMPRGMPMQGQGGYPVQGYPNAGYPPKAGGVNYNISHLMNPMEVNNVRNAQETKTINIDPFAGLKK